MLLIAKGFGTAGARSGERTCRIAQGEASSKIQPAYKPMQKSRVEAISCTDGIDDRDLHGRHIHHVSRVPCGCSSRSPFDHKGGDQAGQLRDGLIQVVDTSHPQRFPLIGKKHIYVAQEIEQSGTPLVIWVIIGVERNGEAPGFQVLEQVHDPRLQPLLQVKRRKMEVTRIRKVIEIYVLKRQLED